MSFTRMPGQPLVAYIDVPRKPVRCCSSVATKPKLCLLYDVHQLNDLHSNSNAEILELMVLRRTCRSSSAIGSAYAFSLTQVSSMCV